MKKYIYKFLGLGAIVATLTSCLDEDPLFDPSKTTGIIEIVENAPLESAGSIYPMNTLAFDVVAEDEFEVIVSYSGAYNAPEDITVEVSIDPAAVAAYNEDQGLHDGDAYSVLESNMFSLPGGGSSVSVTIPKGEKRATFMVTVNPDKFGFTEKFALPLKISNASSGVVSGNFNTMLYAVIAKNQWDGSYANTYSGNLGSGSNNVNMYTTGQYSVRTSLIGVYSNEVFLTVDPTDNSVTVDVPSLVPVETDPSSHWDPATATFYLKYTMRGGGYSIEQTLRKR